MSRFIVLAYGILSYVISLAGLTYFFLYVGAWEFLPIHIDSEVPGPALRAVMINLFLIILFGLQHSVMARPSFKTLWIRIIPAASERSTYVLLSGIFMFIICYFWQALDGSVWQVDNEFAQNLLIAIQLLGWTIAVVSTFIINHFELMGLQQVYYNFISQPIPTPVFTDRLFYKIVRHPLQFGMLLGLWSTPSMSLTHLYLAIAMTIYIFIGLYFEERNLAEFLGEDYDNYRGRVRMIIPIPK